MLSARFKPYHVPLFLLKYGYLRARRRPVLVHFEVTERCNARCGFCDFWKTPAEARHDELASFADAARFFNPMLVTWTGGEPLLRRDLEALVAGVNAAVRLKYVTLITHGGMLTPERARSLWDAGVNQFNISLDYLDARHDRARGIPGSRPRSSRGPGDARRGRRQRALQHRHQGRQPRRGAGDRARGRGARVRREPERLHRREERQPRPPARRRALARVDALVAELLAFKRRRRGVITNSDYYLEQIPRYVRGEMTEPCRSGRDTVHIGPTGLVAAARTSLRRTLARVRGLRADRLQCVLLRVPRRGAGAAAAVARVRRDGVHAVARAPLPLA
jgi:hypothetical protein